MNKKVKSYNGFSYFEIIVAIILVFVIGVYLTRYGFKLVDPDFINDISLDLILKTCMYHPLIIYTGVAAILVSFYLLFVFIKSIVRGDRMISNYNNEVLYYYGKEYTAGLLQDKTFLYSIFTNKDGKKYESSVNENLVPGKYYYCLTHDGYVHTVGNETFDDVFEPNRIDPYLHSFYFWFNVKSEAGFFTPIFLAMVIFGIHYLIAYFDYWYLGLSVCLFGILCLIPDFIKKMIAYGHRHDSALDYENFRLYDINDDSINKIKFNDKIDSKTFAHFGLAIFFIFTGIATLQFATFGIVFTCVSAAFFILGILFIFIGFIALFSKSEEKVLYYFNLFKKDRLDSDDDEYIFLDLNNKFYSVNIKDINYDLKVGKCYSVLLKNGDIFKINGVEKEKEFVPNAKFNYFSYYLSFNEIFFGGTTLVYLFALLITLVLLFVIPLPANLVVGILNLLLLISVSYDIYFKIKINRKVKNIDDFRNLTAKYFGYVDEKTKKDISNKNKLTNSLFYYFVIGIFDLFTSVEYAVSTFKNGDSISNIILSIVIWNIAIMLFFVLPVFLITHSKKRKDDKDE